LASAYKTLYGLRVDDEGGDGAPIDAEAKDTAEAIVSGVVVWERNFRERMARMREALGMTQTDLARSLKAFGLPFHQQTIQRIESGERPIRLNEANLIAQTLDADLLTMMAGVGKPESVRFILRVAGEALAEKVAEAVENISEHMEDLERRHDDVEYAWGTYVSTQEQLGEPIDSDLSADMRRYESRYERARHGLALIMELGDF